MEGVVVMSDLVAYVVVVPQRATHPEHISLGLHLTQSNF